MEGRRRSDENDARRWGEEGHGAGGKEKWVRIKRKDNRNNEKGDRKRGGSGMEGRKRWGHKEKEVARSVEMP